MSFWKRLFGNSETSKPTGTTTPAHVSDAPDRKTVPASIAKRYNLTQSGSTWIYKGKGTDMFAHDLADPEVCYETLKKIQKDSDSGLDQVCLVAGRPPLLVLRVEDTPYCLTTALEQSGIADFVLALTKNTPALKIIEYNDLWIIDLPNL